MEIPSHRAERYDRQLRLWGDQGQYLLESSHVCLVNATAAGTEILKNIVLPGVGAFTIIGSGTVSSSDLGANFFVTHNDMGKSKSQVTMEYLQELNSEVKGSYIDEDFETIVGMDANFFSQFAVVLGCDLHNGDLLKLSNILWKLSIPLLLARSYGLMGYLRISTPSHEILESHPDNYHNDLRLDISFPELTEYMNKIELMSLYSSQGGNIPYLVILYKCLQKWKSTNKEFPSNYKDKAVFKLFIQQEFSSLTENSPEENVDEALKNVNSLMASFIPQKVLSVFEDPRCGKITPESTNFWILARAVSDFVQNEGKGNLPLRGTLPDMISSTELYIELQQVYLACANKDAEVVLLYVQELLSSIGRPKGSITKSDVKDFCKNSAFIGILKYRSISDEYLNPKLDDLRSFLDDPSNDALYYVLLRAAEKYYEIYQCYPGAKEDNLDSDVAQLKALTVDFLCSQGLPSHAISDEHITEFCRYGGCELHSVAAFLGGVAAQEVIKLITHQYVPLNNTLIYHAASCKTVSFTI